MEVQTTNKNNIEDENNDNKTDSPASFEEAISATGFGKYNYYLLFVICFPCLTNVFNNADLSFILSAAQCDLNLTLEDKGILNGVMFAGMVSSGLIWGFLCDAFGRKNILVYGYFTSGVFGLIAAMSANKNVLIAAKFLSGVVINGPFSASTAHIAEFHSTNYRSIVNTTRGIFLSLASLIMPVLAWAILPRTWNISVFGLFELHSWNFFLIVCSLTTVVSGIFYIFLPESPKYLMSTGRNKQALLVMQRVYALNTGKSGEEFPVRKLHEEVARRSLSGQITIKDTLIHELKEFKKIFHHPYLLSVALVVFNDFTLMSSVNTLKLWLPSIFQSVSDYKYIHNGTTSSVCDMLQMIQPQNVSTSTSETCIVAEDSLSVYVNTFIAAFTRILAFSISTPFVKWMGVKTLNICCCFLTTIFNVAIYFAYDETTITTLSSVGTAIGSVAGNLLLSLTLEMFPTTLRTIAISLHYTFGRAGTLMGNIIFPHLINAGCFPPFLFIGISSLGKKKRKFLNLVNIADILCCFYKLFFMLQLARWVHFCIPA
ncbi:unnamed protein product [Phyllotreta striolata]|uniref:Major facilitator superfamily (MFS) profile domain-containing protein n=1 Tax=Phyllotreta striolata TaxID=444603 RepID=A0A9P0GN87_PHYSR|nr:unnamed protein product [Phyllotreta striolata]